MKSLLDEKEKKVAEIQEEKERAEGSQEILALPNLDALIRAALTTSRKSLPNEKAFFTFLFENSLGPYVKNRSKINEYYQLNRPWYEV